MGSSRFAECCQSPHPRIIGMYKGYNSLCCEPNAVYRMNVYWLKYKRFGTIIYRCMATAKYGVNCSDKVCKLPAALSLD